MYEWDKLAHNISVIFVLIASLLVEQVTTLSSWKTSNPASFWEVSKERNGDLRPYMVRWSLLFFGLKISCQTSLTQNIQVSMLISCGQPLLQTGLDSVTLYWLLQLYHMQYFTIAIPAVTQIGKYLLTLMGVLNPSLCMPDGSARRPISTSGNLSAQSHLT